MFAGPFRAKLVIRLAITFLLTVASQSALAQELEDDVPWPDTPAGRRARAYFEAYEADTDEAMRRFIRRNRSKESLKQKSLGKRVAENRKIRKQIGRLKIALIDSHGDLALDVVAQSATHGIWLRFAVQLEPDPPHYWIDMVGRPTKAPQRKSKVYDRWETLADLAKQVRDDIGAPALAVAIARGGAVTDRVEIGIRRTDQSDPIQNGDRFHIGSVTKPFTATMIASLVQRGITTWDATVGSVLSNFPVRKEYRSVTLEQLLRHRGGVPPMPTGGMFESDVDPAGLTPQEGRETLVRQVLSEEPISPSGRRKVYSNAGYVVAAYMVERITGRAWEALMQETVFEPLQLRSAEIGWPATAARPNQPRGHFGSPPQMRVQQIGETGVGGLDFGVFLAPAGHVSCSCEDLAQFGSAHIQGLLGQDGALTADTIGRLHRPGPQGKDENGYAYGWVTGKNTDGTPRHWHNGSGGTFYASLTIYPESDLVVALATNVGLSASDAFNAMRDAIYKRYASD